MATYAISDIHGCFNTFKALLEQIKLEKTDKLFILGDLIDRGSQSAQVVDHILYLRSTGFDITCLRGNHEDFLLKCLNDVPEYLYWWFVNGGKITLKSYGNDATADWKSAIPKEHIDFYKAMPVIAFYENFVLVHAGLDFSKESPIRDTDEHTMMWERDFICDSSKIQNKTLITGHTPTPLFPSISVMRDSGHVIIDNGCVFKDARGFGNLVALNLDNMELFHVPNCEE